MMKATKGSGVWVRLEDGQREDIEKEADVSGFNMSEVIRQRLFRDPMVQIERRLEKLEARTLTDVACSNMIIEILNLKLFPPDKQLSKVAIQARLTTLKALVIKAENARAQSGEHDD